MAMTRDGIPLAQLGRGDTTPHQHPAGGPAAPTGSPIPNPNQGLIDFGNSALGKYLNQSGTTPAATDYLGQFHGAISAARGNLQQQLAGALGDIAASQANANRALGTLPGQIDTAYGQTDAGMANALSAGNKTLQGNGFRASGATAADLRPEQLAIHANRDAQNADVPLIGIGIQQQGQNLSAQARNTELGDENALALQQAQGDLSYGQQQQSQAAAEKAQREGAIQSFLEQVYMNNHPPKTPADKQPPATGQYQNTGLTTGQVNSVHKDPEYARFNKLINSGTANSQEVINILSGKHPDLLATLMAENPTFFKSSNSLDQNGKVVAGAVGSTPGQASSPNNGGWMDSVNGALNTIRKTNNPLNRLTGNPVRY